MRLLSSDLWPRKRWHKPCFSKLKLKKEEQVTNYQDPMKINSEELEGTHRDIVEVCAYDSAPVAGSLVIILTAESQAI
jgi:hypothetical protein